MRARSVVPSGRTPLESDALAQFALDVAYYLSQDPRQLPSRYLYDRLGSSLFETICLLPWYAVARAETDLLRAHAREIFDASDPLARVVELGGGSGEKLTMLLRNRRYLAPRIDVHLIDVSSAALTESAKALAALEATTVIEHEATYEAGLAALRDALSPRGRTLMLFLGSNIGNFDPPGAHEFVRHIRAALRSGDRFLLGADLVKPEPVLLRAYDDPLGVTAAFNLNLLLRINRELGGDFDLETFEHEARWNAAKSRIEMHLVSRQQQTVRVEAADLEIVLDQGESIWTESSYKYEPHGVTALVEGAGFSRIEQWIDEPDRFALTLFEAL